MPPIGVVTKSSQVNNLLATYSTNYKAMQVRPEKNKEKLNEKIQLQHPNCNTAKINMIKDIGSRQGSSIQANG